MRNFKMWIRRSYSLVFILVPIAALLGAYGSTCMAAILQSKTPSTEKVLQEPGILDMHEFITGVFAVRDQHQYALATAQYLDLLSKADDPMTDKESEIMHRHIARFVSFLPKSFLRQHFEGLKRGDEILTLAGRLHRGWSLKPGSGAQLAAWWRAQDPLPATPINERLVEHLERAAFASEAYPVKKSQTGWDDRGLVYVRLGKPHRQGEISFSDVCLDWAFSRSPGVSISDFPQNKVWFYDELGASALFVFAGNPYQLKTPSQLIPRHLQLAASRKENTAGPVVLTTPPSEAAGCGDYLGVGSRKQILLLAMQHLYKNLIPFHGDFGGPYLEVATFVQTPPKEKLASERGLPPDLWAKSALANNLALESRLLKRREKTVPKQVSNALRGTFLLPLEARHARFLNEDGSTRTEVYWTIPAVALQVHLQLMAPSIRSDADSDNRFLITTTAIQKASDHTPRDAKRDQIIVRIEPNSSTSAFLPVQSFVIPGGKDRSIYHIAAQWALYPLVGRDSETKRSTSEPISIATFHADTLHTLDARQNVLEMSDLVPVRAAPLLDGKPGMRGEPSFSPYPFTAVSGTDPLGLYFEIYHLVHGADDRTHYTVEYEVISRKKGGLLQLFQDRTEQTSARASYDGDTRTAREHVVLDMQAWDLSDELEVIVRVVDDVTGQHVERTVNFNLLPKEEEDQGVGH